MAFPGGFDTARRQRVALVLLWPLLLAAWSSPVESSPLTKPEVLKLVRKSVQEMRLLAVVRELGVDFKVTFEVADELRAAGASASLIAALRGLASPAESFAPSAPAPPAPPPPPASSPEPPPLQPVAAPPAAPPPPAPPPVPVTPPQPPPPAPPPATASASPPPAGSVGSEPKGPAPPAGDPPPRDEGPPPALEPPPPVPLPRGALETMVALIPGPPPPPPPPVLGATAGLAESPVPSPPSEPTAPASPVLPVPVVTLAPVVPVPPPPRPEPPSRWDQIRPLLEKAQALAADGDVRGAQMLVVKAMEMDPGEPQVWKTFKGIEQDLLIRAETFLADGQLPRALREFQFIISTNPESALGFNGVGQALLQLKNYDEAVAAFEKALVLEPGNARYRQALTRARSLQKASRAFERQGQQNVKDMIEGQPGKKKGP